MRNFDIHDTPIEGLVILERDHFSDSRGGFERIFCLDSLSHLFEYKAIKQVNRSTTREAGTVRGLHFQHPPSAECKLVTCLQGEVWDVAVDIRKGSPTFLRHHAVCLSKKNRLAYLIPEGFAHGFQALTDFTELLYFHTANFDSAAEGSINASDPELDIIWPLLITERSQRDLESPLLPHNFMGIEV